MIECKDICVLLVDDEEGIREVLAANLELDNFKVLTASGGNEAVEILKCNRIDFIISDVRMPKGDGVFLLKHVKENYPHLPHVLLFSGFAEINAEQVKQLGGIDLISKPPNIDQLIDMIKLYCKCF